MSASRRCAAVLVGAYLALVVISGCDAIVGVEDLLPGSDTGPTGMDATVDVSPRRDSTAGDVDAMATESGSQIVRDGGSGTDAGNATTGSDGGEAGDATHVDAERCAGLWVRGPGGDRGRCWPLWRHFGASYDKDRGELSLLRLR